jgi:hypothetical protein
MAYTCQNEEYGSHADVRLRNRRPPCGRCHTHEGVN